MKTEIYKYTTIWNATEGARGLSKLAAPQTDSVRIIVGPTIKPKELATLAEASGSVARVRLVIAGRNNPAWLSLALFRNLFGVQAYGLGESDLEDFKHVPATIRELELGIDQQPSLFVAALSRFTSLTRLCLSGKLMDLEFARFTKLSELSLHYLPKLELKALLELKGLKSLRVHHGSVLINTNSKIVSKLQKLDLWKIAGLDDLHWLGSLTELRTLEIGVLSKVQVLPKLSKLTQLSFVRLDQLKSLSSLVPLSSLPALSRLHVEGMNQIPIQDYLSLSKCPSLTEITPGYSSKIKNEQVSQELDLPRVQYEPIYDIREF